MTEKLYKIINGIRTELNEQEYLEYFNRQNINIDLQKIKENKIKDLKYNCSMYIYSIYPQFKQMNIANGINCSDDDLYNMKSFITQQINICNTKEIAINNCSSIEEISSIDIEY